MCLSCKNICFWDENNITCTEAICKPFLQKACKKPEATSSLDNETEKNIQGALTELSQNRTTLVVAHRLATIRHVDRIIVLSRSGILEQGSHEELMAKQGEYYKLYMAQME